MARGIARSLTCRSEITPADAVIVDTLESDYVLFERARELRRRGLAARVLVPVAADTQTLAPLHVGKLLAEALVNASRLGAVEYVPVRINEPITLNAVRDIKSYVESRRIHKIIIVVPLLRSRRTQLVYGSVFRSTSVSVACDPGPAPQASQWHRTWHGRQNVAEQLAKLLYYRLYVLPFLT